MNQNNSKIFYGWYIVGITFLSNFMSTGTGFYIFNTFIEPLCAQRGWSRTDINIAPMMGILAGFFCTMIYGSIVSRIGARILIVCGSILSGISFALLGRVQEIWLFYIFYMLLYVGNGAMSGIVSNTVVNNWFEKKRGRAVGLATSGISLSGAVLPLTAMFILEKTNLVTAFQSISCVTLLIAPIAWLLMKNRPEDHGLQPDGLNNKIVSIENDENLNFLNNHNANSLDANYWTFSKVIREQAFWKIGISYGLVLAGISGIMFQLKPYFTDIGFDSTTAIFMLSATALFGTIGKYIWGMLCDKFEPGHVTATLIAINGIGLGFLFFQNSKIMIILFIIVFGFSMGGVMSTLPIIIADIFGRDSFPYVARFIPIIMGISAIGYLLMGQSFDKTGSYGTAYSIFFLLDIIAVFLILTVRKRPHEMSAVSNHLNNDTLTHLSNI